MAKFFTARALLAGFAAAAALGAGARADQVFADDLIVQGSACVGQDCVNGENFGFDTIRLKENNLRIDFTDTSNSGAFPSVDWTIVANDSANGGANYLAFTNDDAGVTPFRVESSAGNNALRVTGSGNEPRIGVGTATPSVAMHVRTGNTPTLRLDQDGSSGFTSQVWDIAGNEANFFIRDVTNGSRLPLRIEPGAAENALYIENTSHIGLGTNDPVGRLHIKGAGSERQMILLEQTTADTVWTLSNFETGASEGDGNFGINRFGGGNLFKLDTTGGVYFPTVPNCANGIRTDASGQLSCIP